MAAASSPLHMPPKSAISLARAMPTSRGSSQDAPLSRARPRLAKIMESLARSLQTTRSQPSASDNPAPTAKPSTLAMVGLETWCRASATSPRRRMRARPDRVGSVAGPLGSERSAPEQKAPPAPVSTITLSSGLSSTSSKVVRSSVSILPLAAFLRSGRFIVTVTTPSLRSTISVSMGTDPMPRRLRTHLRRPRASRPARRPRRSGPRATASPAAAGRPPPGGGAGAASARSRPRADGRAQSPVRAFTSQTTRVVPRAQIRSISPARQRQFRSSTA